MDLLVQNDLHMYNGPLWTPAPPPYPQIGGGGRGDRAPSPLKIYKLPKIYLYVGKTCIYSHLFGEEGGGIKS